MLRPGTAAPLAGGGALSRVRRRRGDPGRLRRQAAEPTALSLQGLLGAFHDLTGTVLAGHHQPLRVWVLCLYFLGLNLSNERGSVRRLWREKRPGV